VQTETESNFPQESDYELRQAAMDAAYAEEYRRWVSTLSEDARQRLTLDGLDKPDAQRAVWTTAGGGGGIDLALVAGRAGHEDDERVPTIDAHTLEDSDHDQLCEIGLSTSKADAVLQWIARRNDAEVNRLAADRLARFFSLLLPVTTAKKINLNLLGTRSLAALFLMNRNGSTTLTELANRAGMSKQLFDFHVRRLGDAMHFHGFGLKKESTRANYSEAARARWAALTPEQRIARRHGAKGIVGTQHSTNDDQNLTISPVL
jgi:hypothetical protein